MLLFPLLSRHRFTFITPTQFLTSQEFTLLIIIWQVTFSGRNTLERSFFLLDARRKTGSVLFLIFGLAATVPERWAWLSVITGPLYTAATSANCLASLSQEIVIHKESEQKRASAAGCCCQAQGHFLRPTSNVKPQRWSWDGQVKSSEVQVKFRWSSCEV